MQISVGQELPNTSVSQMTEDGPITTKLKVLTSGKKIVLIGMPGAFTNTCTNQHLPSLIRNSSILFARGIDEIICIVVNGIHVTKAWAEITGAAQARIKILSDLESEFATASGLSFSAPTVGFFKRLQRVLIMVDDNIIKHIQLEPSRGECELTSGDAIPSLITKVFDR